MLTMIILLRALTHHFKSSCGLDFSEFVFHRDAVEAGVVGGDVAYLQRPVIVVLAYSHSAVDAYWPAVFFPRRPGRRVTRHTALEPDRLAHIRYLVVEDRVEFRRAAPFQSLGTPVVWFTCSAVTNTWYNNYVQSQAETPSVLGVRCV